MSAHNRDPITLETAWSMLHHIDATGRDTWLRVGMALKSEFDDAGFDLFDSWSQTAGNYNARSARDVWRSFKRGGVGIGSLVALALEGGYQSGRGAIREPLPAPAATLPPRAQKRDTGAYAAQLWLSARHGDNLVAAHPYCQRKGITHAGGAKRGTASGRVIGADADCVIVPIRGIETEIVRAVQCINSDGAKQTFGALSGNALILGNAIQTREPWYVVEGWASGFSVVWHHGKHTCAVAFGKSNMRAIAERIDALFKPGEIFILREDDSK
jgi:putative DNA primase/helicase